MAGSTIRLRGHVLPVAGWSIGVSPKTEVPSEATATYNAGSRAAGLKDVEGDAVVLRSGFEVRTDIEVGNGDSGLERLGGSEGLSHDGGEWAAICAVATLELSHRPRELTEVQDLDRLGQGYQQRTEPVLLLS